MAMSPEMRKGFDAVIEREARRVQQRVLDRVESLGVRLTPCGTTTFCQMLHGMCGHIVTHAEDNKVSMEFAVQCADEFMALWVIQRLEEDPDWLDKARKATVEQVSHMFQKDVPDLKVTL